ncbi:hypothetical protein MPH_00054 [Macrophomina phaseolina MS6]|uniref:Short-chain dehydrogenase/reductase SDR n=1 Tax=Macrophomina phaseolina (strain MS6) TaxID=1126212 RepID=K2RJ70_MACPH|nr:hypothetical protein MPH_00054 [Macrophomina phaseolina MS6]
MVHSNMLNKVNPFMRYVVGPVILKAFQAIHYFNPNGIIRTVGASAADVERAAFGIVDQELGSYPKDLYLDGAKRVEAATESFDEEKQKELWTLSVKLAQVDESKTALG